MLGSNRPFIKHNLKEMVLPETKRAWTLFLALLGTGAGLNLVEENFVEAYLGFSIKRVEASRLQFASMLQWRSRECFAARCRGQLQKKGQFFRSIKPDNKNYHGDSLHWSIY